MSWLVVNQGTLRFRGRLSREPFSAWVGTKEGADAVRSAAAGYRFRLMAAARARRGLWRSLEIAARSAPVRSALEEEALRFAATLAQVSYAPGLPRTTIALRRLVVVPRALVVARARMGVRERIWKLLAAAGVEESVRTFFCERLLIEADLAIEVARPSAKRPVVGADGWWCVGTDRPYVWVDPLWAGAHWVGHLFMYELPRAGLSRAERRDLDEAVAHLQTDLSSLSRLQRDALVRMAADGLASVPFR
jgi:hypothetical protein